MLKLAIELEQKGGGETNHDYYLTLFFLDACKKTDCHGDND